MIKDLGTEFDLEPENDVSAFLGIKFKYHESGEIELLQPHLIQRIVETVFGKTGCNAKATPALGTPLGTDADGALCCENWDYGSVVGMMMYLASNSRPDIAYAVHQCARFTYCPRHSHEEAVKRIVRYLSGTADKGLIFRPTGKFNVDCYVDADFAGLWRYEDDQDPVCVKSRTGYIIMFGGCPLLWVSRLQTEIALSTTEAEYIALSQAMRDLLPTKSLIEGLLSSLGIELTEVSTFSTVFEDNMGAIAIAQAPKMTPRTKHIGIKYHFFRQFVSNGTVKIKHVESEKQVADIFTKGLTAQKFESLRKSLMGW
jgi:hypothetical protein